MVVATALSSAQAHLGYRDDESNPVWQGTISANTSTGLKSTFSIFDVVNGYGAYTILPLEKLAQLANSEIQTGHSSQEISESCSSLPNIEVGGRCVNPARGLAAGIQLSPVCRISDNTGFEIATTRIFLLHTVCQCSYEVLDDR